MVSLRRLAWLASLLMCACLLQITSANAAGSKRLALVIGNGGYKFVEPFANARNDAKLFAGVLRCGSGVGQTRRAQDREDCWHHARRGAR